LFAGGVFLLAVVLFASGSSAGVLDEIKRRQKGVATVRAAFTQEKRTELLDRPIRSSGTFYFKSGVGVRWEYDEAMVVVYDGRSVFLHYTELDEAEKIEGVSGYAGPLVFDMELLARDYEVAAWDIDGRYRVVLKPKKQMPFESMEMFFGRAAAFPSEVRITEETGDVTAITFRDIKANVEIADAKFAFTPPPGVVLRERRLR
jgi:outer membrane lipoprotein-sorting protein